MLIADAIMKPPPQQIQTTNRTPTASAMPRLFEGTSTKRRPGLGGAGLAAGPSTASSVSAFQTAGNANNSYSRNQQRRTAMDLIDTDSSSSEEDGGSIDSSFDFDAAEKEEEQDRPRQVKKKGKENSGNLMVAVVGSNESSSSAQPRQKSKSKRKQIQQSRQPKKIVVSDKAKGSKTSKKSAASASTSASTKKKRGGNTTAQKSATTTTATSTAASSAKKKKNSSSSSSGGRAKASASTSAAKATKSTRKRSPTRVRFEADEGGSNEKDNDAQAGPKNTASSSTSTSTSTSSPCIPTIPIPPRAVAVDTRTIQSFEGDAAGTAFLRHTLSFLKSAARRGMLPPILAVTASAAAAGGGEGGGGNNAKKSKRAATIRARVVHLPTERLTGREYAVENGSTLGIGGAGASGSGTTSGMTMGVESSLLPPQAQEEQMYWRDILLEAAVPIRCASSLASMDGEGMTGTGTGNVPKPLLAHDSWKYFADLVKSVDGQIQKDNAGATNASSSPNSHHHRPRTLTVFTNDVALFSDTAVDSHKRALGRFWDTIRGSFQNGSVGSVQITIYETGSAALAAGRKRKGSEQAKDSEMSSLEGDIFDDDNGGGEDGSTEQETEEEVAATDEALAHRMRVKQCIALLQREIQCLQEKDRRRSATQISVELLVIESPIKFQTLLREWIRAIISPASGTEGGKISFNLPETLDGSQCAISLDLVPSLLPYRVDSSEAAKLMMDLKALSSAELEVVQVVPISSVDGSLLYGVPMSANAAMDSDLFRYKEMKVLARQLFRYMATKDVAIALRCVGTNGLEDKDSTNATATVEEGQIFLLMAEHPAEPTDHSLSSSSLSGSAAPSRGILYRYATLDHVIHDHETLDALDDDSEDEEMSEQYFEFVEQSLEMVDSKILNPILLPSATVVKRKEEANSLLDEPLSLDMSEADGDADADSTNKSSRGLDGGDAPKSESSSNSDRDDDFTTFFDDDDEDLRFFENDFEY